MKVSIIVPVYHAEKYIRQCVDSLQKQTYQNIEIILVHTCSGDASGVICDEYGARDARIKIIHTEKAGISRARNIGIEAASGDYLLFVDSDDWLDKKCCEEALEASLRHQADIVLFDFYKNDGKEQSLGHLFRTGFMRWEKEDIKKLQLDLLTGIFDDQLEQKRGNNLTAVWGKLFKKSIIDKKVSFYEVDRAEDLLFDLEAFSQASKIIYIRKNYYHYRITDTSATWRFHAAENYSLFNTVWENFIRSEKAYGEFFKQGLEIRKTGQLTGILQGNVFHPDNPEHLYEKRKRYLQLREEYLPSISYVLKEKMESGLRKYLLLAVRWNCFFLSYGLCVLKRRYLFR